MLADDTNFIFSTKCKFRSRTCFDIGRLIYNLTHGSDTGYRLWVMYCEMDQVRFDKFYCQQFWLHCQRNINFTELYNSDDGW